MFFDDFKKLYKENAILSSCSENLNPQIEYVSYNSRDIKENTLFFCKGLHFREEFLLDAIKKGAVGYVAEKKYDVDIPFMTVSDMRLCLGLSANLFYGESHKKIKTIGLTGTKGKTTTAFIIEEILNRYLKDKNLRTGFSSSVKVYDGVNDKKSELTTPEPFELHKFFYNAVNSHLPYFTMEVSSQALKYGRVFGINFDIGCFLNIGTDHISAVEHPNFEDYFESKLKMFNQTKTALVNLDADYADRILKAAKNAEKVYTFSRMNENADFYAKDIKKDGSKTVFTLRYNGKETEYVLGIPGLFNVENALCAIGVCTLLDIPEEFIKRGVLEARSDGRMELHETNDKKIAIIVDYAHNRLSFQKLFESVKAEYPNRKVYMVFGSAGNKAISRRKDLGEVSGQFADISYITEDDPAEEKPEDICNEIAGYVKSQGGKYEIITDRATAIKTALKNCDGESVVLICGKGNETFIKRGTERAPYKSDTYYVNEFLNEYNK